MAVWRERMRAHADAAYVHVIVNEGKEAGASLPHTHAQLYALPFVPAAVARERERFTAYSDRTQGRNLLEDLVQEEVRRRERIVAIDDEAVALCPFAARVPFHLQIVPRRPARALRGRRPARRRACCTRRSRGSGAALGGLPPLNMWVRTAPRGAERFCWRIELLPRLAQLAGLEIGTGVHLNVLAPEDAARAAARREPVAFRRRHAARPTASPACSPPSRRRSRCPTGAGPRRSASSSPPRRRTGSRSRSADDRLVPRPHLGRAHLRARHGAGRRRRRGVRLRLLHARARGRPGRRLPGRAPTSPRRPPTQNPDWTLDLSDEEIGHWRGTEGRRGVDHARLGRGARAERRRWPPPSSGPTTTDQCELVDDRFTLVSLDAYTGDYVEVRLFGARGAELARESLYEDE